VLASGAGAAARGEATEGIALRADAHYRTTRADTRFGGGTRPSPPRLAFYCGDAAPRSAARRPRRAPDRRCGRCAAPARRGDRGGRCEKAGGKWKCVKLRASLAKTMNLRRRASDRKKIVETTRRYAGSSSRYRSRTCAARSGEPSR
jgi:hypothetical protein